MEAVMERQMLEIGFTNGLKGSRPFWKRYSASREMSLPEAMFITVFGENVSKPRRGNENESVRYNTFVLGDDRVTLLTVDGNFPN